MKYMGSKARFAKEILPIILKDREENQWFIDLFCGGCSISQEVDGKVIANDKNKYLVALFKGLQENKDRPIIITKELYSKARAEYNNGTNIELDDFMIGWVGWMGSYNGRFLNPPPPSEGKSIEDIEKEKKKEEEEDEIDLGK